MNVLGGKGYPIVAAVFGTLGQMPVASQLRVMVGRAARRPAKPAGLLGKASIEKV